MKFSKTLSILSILIVLRSTISSKDIEIVIYDYDEIQTVNEIPTISEYELKLGHDLITKSVKKLRVLAFGLYLHMIKNYDFIGSPDNIQKLTKNQCIILITTFTRNSSFLINYDVLVDIARKYSLEIRMKFNKDYEEEISNLLD